MMRSDEEIQQFEEEIRLLENQLSQERGLARGAARASATIGVILCLVVVAFVGVNYLNITSAFTEEKFARSLEAEMRELSPLAIQQLKILGTDVIPVYAAETRTHLVEMRPAILARFEKEIEQLSGDVVVTVHDHLNAAQERVLVRTERLLLENYPGLSNAATREQLSARFHEAAEEAVAGTIVDFDDRFGAEVKEIQESLLEFDLSESDETMVDLQKKFIHLWLELLDQEIMEL